MQKSVELLKETFRQWRDDKVSRLAASIAYFTIFSIAPLLIVIIVIVGAVFGREAATGELVGQIRGLIGIRGAEVIEEVIKNAEQSESGAFATAASVVMLLIGTSGVFIALQDALNTVWGVTPKSGLGIKRFFRKRILSFTLVVVIAFMLLVSLAISALLAGVNNWLNQWFPGGGYVLQTFNFIASFGVITFLFAIIFKYLPDVKIAWRHVWTGAFATAALFSVGKFLIGMYLGNNSTVSVYGAAGSLVVLLIWMFYSAQILLLGAEFTQVYASSTGSVIEPDDDAVAVTSQARARQGLAQPE